MFKESKGEVFEVFKAYSIKWKCQKGHSNFITVLEGDKSVFDTCLRCGKNYNIKL